MSERKKPCLFQAHRGVSSDCPENTMASYREAIKQDYDIIELDPKFTADDRCVLLHDPSVNRTGRDKNGNAPAEKTPISSITYAQAASYEYGSWFDEKFKGEHIPTIEEVLKFSADTKMPLKLDNIIQKFNDKQTEILFDAVEKSGVAGTVGFTSSSTDYIAKVLARFPDANIHYDGIVDDSALEWLSTRIKKERLTVWMRFDNKATAWNKCPPVTVESSEKVRAVAKLGVWIISERGELDTAVGTYHADIIETNGKLKPVYTQ